MTLSAHFFTIPLPKFCLAHWNVYKPTSRLPGFTGTLSLPLSLSVSVSVGHSVSGQVTLLGPAPRSRSQSCHCLNPGQHSATA